MARFDQQIGLRADEAGALIADINAQFAGQAEETAQIVVGGVSPPVIDNTFTPQYTPAKKQRMFVTLRIADFGTARDIKLVLIPRALVLTSGDYDNLRFPVHLTSEITDDIIGLQLITSPLSEPLDPLTQYDIILAIAIEGNNRAFNPSPDPTYAGYPGNVLYTLTTPAQASDAGAPSKPTTARIVANSVDTNTDGTFGTVTFRIFADETEVKTFAQQNIVSVQPKVIKVADGSKAPVKPIAVDDSTQTFLDVVLGDLQIGRQYEWIKNTAFDSFGSGTDSLVNATDFFAGGYRDPSDGLALLTLNSYTGTPTESGTQIDLDLSFNQPTPPYRLKNGNLERSKSGGPFIDQDVNFGLQDLIYNTPGVVHFHRLVDVHPTRTYQYRETIKSVGNFTKQFTSGSIVAASSLQLAASDTAGGGGSSYVDGGSMLYSFQQFEVLDGSTPSAGDDLFLGRAFFVQNSVTTRIDSKAAGTGGSLDNFGLQWRVDEGRLMLNTDVFTKTGTPAFKLKKLMRAGDVWSFTSLWIGDAGVTLPSFAIALVDQNSGDIVVTPTVSFSILSTAQSPFFAFLVIPDAYHMDGNQYLEIRPGSNPSSKIYTANWMLSRNAGYLNWQAHPDEMKMIEPQAGAVSSQGEGMVANDFTVFSTDGREFNKDGIVSGGISPQ